MPFVTNEIRLTAKTVSKTKEDARSFIENLRKSDSPVDMVKPLNPIDLLPIFSEADDEVRVELLSLMTVAQKKSLVDLSCWKGYLPNLDSVGELMRPLIATGIEGAQAAHEGMESELTTLLLKKFIIVHVREDDNDEVPASEGSELIQCPDGKYFIELPDPDSTPDYIRQLLAGMIYQPFDFYHRELECVRHDLQSDLEEEALRWRMARMSDMGFGTYEESLALLSPRSLSEVSVMVEKTVSSTTRFDSDFTTPALYKKSLSGNTLLDGSMKIIFESTDPMFQTAAEWLPCQLGATTNLFMTAVKADLMDFDGLFQRAGWVRDILSLGLEGVIGDDTKKGAKALATLHPTLFFQAGMGLLLPLRQRARKLAMEKRLMASSRSLLFLDSQYLVPLQCMSLDIPMKWDALFNGTSDSQSPVLEPLPHERKAFSSMAELNLANGILEEAEQIPSILQTLRGGIEMDTNSGGLLASGVVLTFLANCTLGRPARAEALSDSDAKKFLKKIGSIGEEEFVLSSMRILAEKLGVPSIENLGGRAAAKPVLRAASKLAEIGRARLISEDPEALALEK